MIPNLNCKRNIIRSGLVLSLGAAVLLSGCYGRFTLTRSIYKWNANISSDRYIRSIIFWPLSIVYVGAAAADAVVVNVLEFWSGDRVVDSAALPDGSQVKVQAAGSGQPMVITIERNGQVLAERQVIRLGDGKYEIRDAAQHSLGTLDRQPDGTFKVAPAPAVS
jgi:hypothetical protein